MQLFYGKYFFTFCVMASASYHEQYRVPHAFSNKWESYVFDDKEYIIEDLPVNWENAKILCRGHHNGSLAVLDTNEKAEFLSEALSESQFLIESVWVGARRRSAEDPAGYRWSQGVELQRTALDVLDSEDLGIFPKHYPLWLNRTHVPIPNGGADCVGLERVEHDKPVFLDLPCRLDRPFVCEREAKMSVKVTELKTVRCREGLYHLFEGRLTWQQAAAHCIMRKMALANVATDRCLKKLGTAMLKMRPSVEGAWIGASGVLGQWTWLDTGRSIFSPSPLVDSKLWPPMRDRNMVKQNGCLELDRHASHPPVFLEARCERKMPFICYEAVPGNQNQVPPPADDKYLYVLVHQLLYWQHAYENCLKMNATLSSLDNNDMMTQLLLTMGENPEEPVNHIWISGRLNMSKQINTDTITFSWYNPSNGNIIPEPKSFGNATAGLYMPPWLDEEYTTDNPCMNLDRQDHLTGLVYGLPCDTPQYSVCLIEKTPRQFTTPTVPVPTTTVPVPITTVPEPTTTYLYPLLQNLKDII